MLTSILRYRTFLNSSCGGGISFPPVLSRVAACSRFQSEGASKDQNPICKVWTDTAKGECLFEMKEKVPHKVWSTIREKLIPYDFSWSSQERRWIAPSTAISERAARDVQQYLSSIHEELGPDALKEEGSSWERSEEKLARSYEPQVYEELEKKVATIPSAWEGESAGKEGFDVFFKNICLLTEEFLPSHIKKERFFQALKESLLRVEDLQTLNHKSVYKACLTSALLGLEPNTSTQLCYLIPSKERLHCVVGYRGLIELAMRSGQTLFFVAKCVYKEDSFEFSDSADGEIRHTPHPHPSERGEITWVYAICTLKTGEKNVFLLRYSDLIKMKTISRKIESVNSPWFLWQEEMCLKAVIKALLRRLELNVEKETKTIDKENENI